MSNRVSALLSIIGSPVQVLSLVLLVIFTVEVAVMVALPYVIPSFFGEISKALFDAILLTAVCAPVLWWVIIGPLRRIAVQELERSETIVANASEGIITFRGDGVILSCNAAMAKLLVTDFNCLVGRNIDSFLVGFPTTFAGLPTSFRHQAIRSNGEPFPVEVSVSEYPSESSGMCIAIIRDLTEAERGEAERLLLAREAEALRAQQMATLAQLATGVAHEIRNPLTSIKMLVQVNRSRFSRDGWPVDDLELVEQEIRRMERSVNSLLAYARPEQGEWAVFSLQPVVGRAVKLVEGRCEQQGVKIRVSAADSAVVLTGDAGQIQQLLLNLLLNACDAMPLGGELTVQSVVLGGRMELMVGDTGEGIRADMQDKLFEPFSTNKPTGVGLGLGICRRIATAHGGTLVGRNRPNGGAEFCLSLPLSGQKSVEGLDSVVQGPSCKVC